MDHLRARENVDQVLSVLSEVHEHVVQVINVLSGRTRTPDEASLEGLVSEIDRVLCADLANRP